MAKSQIPKEVADLIERTWPDGAVERFDVDESYFHEIRAAIERDLRKIKGASLRWDTEAERVLLQSETGDTDDEEDLPIGAHEFQSYHVFFLAPDGEECQITIEDDNLPEEETPGRGRGWYGWAVGISLAARVAVVRFSNYSEYERGGWDTPQLDMVAYSDTTFRPVDFEDDSRAFLGEEVFSKLDALRSSIATVLKKHKLLVLDKTVAEQKVSGLRADSEMYLEEPLSVQDALFFRGL